MLETITDQCTRLELARSELKDNESGLAHLAETKADASKAGREAFAHWKDDFEWRTMENERLTVLVQTLERELAEGQSAQADAALRERHKRQRAANEELARRIVKELSEVNEKAIALLRDAALAAIEDTEINAMLPAGLEKIVSAHILARSRPGRSREELETMRMLLWVRTDNGAVIGNSDVVESLGDGRGIIRRPAPLPDIRCRTGVAERVKFHPAEAPQRPNPFWEMKLLNADGPGVAFDGTDLTHPSQVLQAIDRAKQASEPRQRPVETETRVVASPLTVEQDIGTSVTGAQ